VDQLTEFFEFSKFDPLNVLPNPWYWAGNEVFILFFQKLTFKMKPDILSPYLFDFAGRPDLTQK
jgi:hypothetical protein